MTVPELLELVERAGGVLGLRDDRLRYELPEDADHLVTEIREQRDELLRVLRERLAVTVKRWVLSQCVASSRCASNPSILHREFCVWAHALCDELNFVEQLRHLGFRLDKHGMVEGLALGIDFVTAVTYEHQGKSKGHTAA